MANTIFKSKCKINYKNEELLKCYFKYFKVKSFYQKIINRINKYFNPTRIDINLILDKKLIGNLSIDIHTQMKNDNDIIYKIFNYINSWDIKVMQLDNFNILYHKLKEFSIIKDMRLIANNLKKIIHLHDINNIDLINEYNYKEKYENKKAGELFRKRHKEMSKTTKNVLPLYNKIFCGKCWKTISIDFDTVNTIEKLNKKVTQSIDTENNKIIYHMLCPECNHSISSEWVKDYYEQTEKAIKWDVKI